MDIITTLITQQWFWTFIVPIVTGIAAWVVNRRKKSLDFEDHVRDARLKELEYYKKRLDELRVNTDTLETAVVKWKTKYFHAYELLAKLDANLTSRASIDSKEELAPLLHELELFIKLSLGNEKLPK